MSNPSITPIHSWPQNEETTEASAKLATRPTIGGVKHKVPTRLGYRGGRQEYSWGFQCSFPGGFRHGVTVVEQFKLFLDEDYWKAAFEDEPKLAPGSFRDVQMWFRDFLTSLYNHIVSYFEVMFPGMWETAKVEYIFSYPTTWKQKQVIDKFKEIVKQAGFSDGRNKTHSVREGLSEAEAAAIYTAMSPKDHSIINQSSTGAKTGGRVAVSIPVMAYEEGDVLLVCDAGGGTTDVCVLEVRSIEGSRTVLGQLSYVKGEPIGSVQIDDEFRGMAEKRLTIVKEALRDTDPCLTPRYVAREMTRGQFQFHKHSCGDDLANLIDVAAIPVPGLLGDFNCKDAGIEGGRMMFSKKSIEAMFDKKIQEIIKLINKQLKNLENRDSSKVSHLVLAGGLGASEYVQKQISFQYSGAGMKILVSEDPQLSVCKGLVVDRIYQLRYNSSALTIRRCRASYGILIPKKDKTTAIGLRSNAHKICWMVEKDEPVQTTTCKLSRIVDSSNPQKVWVDEIVISSLRKGKLPTRIRSSDKAPSTVKTIGFLESDLSPYTTLSPGTTPGITTIKSRLSLRPNKLKFDYEVKVAIGPEGLQFKSFLDGTEDVGAKLVSVSWTLFPDAMVEEVREGVGGEQREESSRKWDEEPSSRA